MASLPFAYCPYCAAPLSDKLFGGKTLRTCLGCGFVQHHDPKVAVIARIEHGNAILLVRRGVNPGKGLWALPGGYMDAGEMPERALRREIDEELALAIDVHELLRIYPMVNQAQASQGIVLVYRATLPNLAPTAVPLTPAALDDVAEACWFTPEQLPGDLAFASTLAELRQWSSTRLEQEDY
jgi:ADP-ribose pyrophosphatase YjhB (NUDIX family)